MLSFRTGTKPIHILSLKGLRIHWQQVYKGISYRYILAAMCILGSSQAVVQVLNQTASMLQRAFAQLMQCILSTLGVVSSHDVINMTTPYASLSFTAYPHMCWLCQDPHFCRPGFWSASLASLLYRGLPAPVLASGVLCISYHGNLVSHDWHPTKVQPQPNQVHDLTCQACCCRSCLHRPSPSRRGAARPRIA